MIVTILWKDSSINLNNIGHIHNLFNTNKKILSYSNYSDDKDIFYIGPSFSRRTPWSSNVQEIIQNANINEIKFVEKFTVYVITFTIK